MTQLNVTELDFNAIKASLKTYFKSRTEFTDWDFDGSGLNMLLDVLALNTHQNAINAHVALNEAFLQSAQLRSNVVAHGKLLGYIPRSVIGSIVYVDVIVSGGGASGSPNTLTLDRGTRFTATAGGTTYNFIALETVTSDPVDTNGEYVFTNVLLKEGTMKLMKYRTDASLDNQRFVIPETNVDTSSIAVTISDPSESDTLTYTPYTDISALDEDSQVFFIQENVDGRYELYLGDGIIGKNPSNNSVVSVEYVYSRGPDTNGAKVFNAAEAIGGFGSANDAIVTLSASNTGSYGGLERESIESIRRNAPLSIVTQNRCVTADDYKSIILRDFGEVDAISVWGGENDPEPNYGKVYISIKPLNADYLTDAQKATISSIIAGKNVVTITPEFKDPDYTYLRIEAFARYNPRLTTKTISSLESAIYDSIIAYNDDELNRFDGVFRLSAFLNAIDSSDPGILSSVARVWMNKSITPTSDGTANTFNLKFAEKILATSRDEPILTSSSWKYGGISYYLKDAPIAGTVNRRIYRYKNVDGVAIRSNSPFGVIYAESGQVILENIRSDDGASIRIEVPANSYDIAPDRNELISIDSSLLTIDAEIDEIAASGSSGAKDYEPTAKQR